MKRVVLVAGHCLTLGADKATLQVDPCTPNTPSQSWLFDAAWTKPGSGKPAVVRWGGAPDGEGTGLCIDNGPTAASPADTTAEATSTSASDRHDQASSNDNGLTTTMRTTSTTAADALEGALRHEDHAAAGPGPAAAAASCELYSSVTAVKPGGKDKPPFLLRNLLRC